MRYVELDGCACPRPMYPILKKLKAESGCTYNSINRSDDPGAVKILHANGKHTQSEVIRLHAEGVPGFGPANPVDETTHCLRNDGVAYPSRPARAKLPFWCNGFDVNDDQVEDVIAAAKKLGWEVFRPYGSGSEYHHLNFGRKPARWKLLLGAVFVRKRHKAKPKKAASHLRRPRLKHLSEAGAKLIAGFEGFRAAPYQDAVGVWTIGYGHTKGVGPHTKGETRAKALTQLEADAEIAATAVRDLVRVPLNQHQFDALVSFAFNLGNGALAGSTLLKKLNKGNYPGADREFGKWVYAGGQKLAGLVTRRKAEAELFAR